MSNDDLKTSYGTVYLQKGTILYHTSDKSKFTLSPDYPFLFTTLHPSEWTLNSRTYITTVKLKRHISLLFMVEQINDLKIFSALNTFLETNNSVSAKKKRNNIKCWIPYLQKEQLDGWFSSIENKTTVEFAILNDPSILKIIKTEPYNINSWSNTVYNSNNNITALKKWGEKYIISTIIKPVIFVINSRFKSQIYAYLLKIKKENPNGTAFSVMLENAIIHFFNGPLKKIKWC